LHFSVRFIRNVESIRKFPINVWVLIFALGILDCKIRWRYNRIYSFSSSCPGG